MDVGTYDPFSATVTKSVTISVITDKNCSSSFTFLRNPATPTMTLGTGSLSYQIEAVGGGSSYVVSSITGLPAANRIDFTTLGLRASTATVQVRIAASQIVAAGTYTDTGVTLILASQANNGTWSQIASTAVMPSATVPKVCRLDTPSPASISFAASEIPGGTPNPATIKSTTMTAACTAPTILRLTGSALALTPAASSFTGFDDFINYRAVGSFGAAISTLTTTTTSGSASSVAKNVASGVTTAGSVSVNVNLIAGNPAMAGTYSGVLTVTIDPNL
jgi:hypothetical protein